jgi:CRP-like cAMP-binding protein
MFFVSDTTSGKLDASFADLLITYGASYKKVSKQELIFREGQKAQFFYIIESGRVKMYNVNNEGREFIQGFFEAGNSFGEPPLIAAEQYPASAVALEPTVLIRMTRDKFVQMIKENPDVHIAFTSLLAKRLLAKAQNMKDLTSYGPEHRILSLLKQYKKHCGCPDNQQLQVELTRQEIADMTGLRVETVIRTMKHMEEKGVLTIEHRKVIF